jgi:hypothetical protein
MTIETIRVSPSWLELREAADAAARARQLVGRLRHEVPADGHLLIHDLACGSGAMGRWLAPLLPGPQHWVLHDRDPDLLALATINRPSPAAGGAEVTLEARVSDVTRLGYDDLAGATLVTTSAFLDLLTRDELTGIIEVCAEVGCPVLFTLSVTGRVRLLPADPLDAMVAAAFHAHQRRVTPRGRLLGPDAVEAAAEGFRRLGAEVVIRPSPWRLGPRENALAKEWLTGWVDAAKEWLTGWVDAACEQDPALRDADLYRSRRLNDAAAGVLAVTVGHADLLVLP